MNTNTNTSRLRPLAIHLAITLIIAAAAHASEMKEIPLKAEPNAGMAKLAEVTGEAKVNVKKGTVELSVTLPPGTSLPKGSVLEGWLSSAGDKGGPGKSSASMDDQKFGPAFGMEKVAMTSRELPYALSTGVLTRQGDSQTYKGSFHIDNVLTPYAAVAVTLESDGNKGHYDPRPGSPLLAGMIK